MHRTVVLARNFNWRMLLMRMLVNMFALLFTVLVVPKVFFVDRSLGSWILMAIGLGVLNALIKPIIQFLTLRFIFITGGLVLIAINSIMLYLLSWLLPNQLSVSNLLWAVVAGAVLGLSSAFLENLLGLTPPIVSDKYPEIRQRVKDRQFYRVQTELSRIESLKEGPAREIATARTMVVETHPVLAGLLSPEKESTPVELPIHSPENRTSGQAFALEQIAAIESVDIEKLSGCGVNTIQDLLERASTRKGRDSLVEQSGISSADILTWVNYADLMRIDGVSAGIARLLEAGGVDTVVELAQRNPAHLFEKLLMINDEKKLAQQALTRPEIEGWIEQAKGLPKLITY